MPISLYIALYRHTSYYGLTEAQPNTSLEAHKCGLGLLAIGTLVTKGSGPNTDAVGGGHSSFNHYERTSSK